MEGAIAAYGEDGAEIFFASAGDDKVIRIPIRNLKEIQLTAVPAASRPVADAESGNV